MSTPNLVRTGTRILMLVATRDVRVITEDRLPVRRPVHHGEARPSRGSKVWRFALREGTFIVDDGKTLLYEVRPTTVFGFGKGEFSQTRWRF